MTTPFPIPAVTTSSATSITTTSATLAGSLGSLNGLPSANVSFQRSTTSGSYTNETGAVSMSTTGAVQINLTGLTRNTKYYFRIT